ncbi:MAG: redoxin domain-containing protein [Pirellulales bacterium]
MLNGQCKRQGALGIAICCTILCSPGPTCLAGEASSIGRKVEPFELVDYYGQARRLADLAADAKGTGSKLVVVAFLGAECPLAKLYAPRLQKLSEEYGPRGVAFVGVDANAQDSLTDMAAFARSNQLRFTLLADRDGAVAEAFGALRNPAVYVLDEKRVIRYHGRVDDQYGLGDSSGYARPQIQRRDLAAALDELLAGKEVSRPITPVTGCVIGRKPKVEPKGEVTFAKHVAPLLQEKCVACHRAGEVGPFALVDYDEVVGWAEMIREVVSQGRMPPWSADPKIGHFANDPRLSDEQKELLNQWVDNGCPQGDPKDMPAARRWVEGWQIAQPDQVVKIPRPEKVPAEGVIAYKYLLADPGWTEDKWIAAAEARPDNRAVVHHILVGTIPPLSEWKKGEAGKPQPLTSFVPGSPPMDFGPGRAAYVPAGSKIMFEIHYTPNGAEQTDQSSLGLVFADPATVKNRILYKAAELRKLTIPANASNHELTSSWEFKTDHQLLTMSPHMHLRGKTFRYEAVYPDGRSEVLLDVPRYDFNWQLRYVLAEPKLMPAGTRLVCYARYDNSKDNLANPNPDKAVEFGWQTWEEMMAGFFTAVVLDDSVPAIKAQAARSASK